MPVQLTAAQARALGIHPADAAAPAGESPARPRRGGGRRAGDYHTVCVDCALEFASAAAETRHLNETKHARYQLVLVFDDADLRGERAG